MNDGPNMRRLAAHKMAIDAIPAGGSFADGIHFLSNPDLVARSAKVAREWAQSAVDAVRQASDPNPWRDADNEAIAAEILRQVNAKKGHQSR